MEALRDIRDQHAWSHAAAVSGAASPTTFDRLLQDLTAEQLRVRPRADINSIAWLIWHIARIEDATVNALAAGTAQVIERDGWRPRLGVAGDVFGTGMGDDEVAAVTARIDTGAVLAYRIAVGRRTQAVMAEIRPADLDAPVDPARVAALTAAGAQGEAAEWLGAAWRDRPLRFFLAMPATAHSFIHLGEAWCVRTLLGAGGGR